MKLVIYRSLNELKQASVLNHTFIDLKYSAFLSSILLWLLKNGYIHSFVKILNISDKRVGRDTPYPCLRVYLKYLKSGRGVLNNLSLLGKPSKHYILNTKNVKNAQGGVILLSTKYGLITAEEARRSHIGGLAVFLIKI